MTDELQLQAGEFLDNAIANEVAPEEEKKKVVVTSARRNSRVARKSFTTDELLRIPQNKLSAKKRRNSFRQF